MTLFDFSDYGALLGLVTNSLIAGALLGIVGGLVGFFVMARDLPFAVHGISELSFAGAAGALLLGADVVAGSVVGSVVAALLIGLLGARARERNSVIGVLMPFGLGLGILFLALYPGRSANRFGLLTGQVVSVDGPQVLVLIAVSLVVLVTLLLVWRPLLFASVDEDVAIARGVPTRGLSMLFMVLLALTVSVAVQTVGALLVLALLVTPAAAALRVASGPLAVSLLSMLFATVAVVGGILIALGSAIPISPFVTTISFLIYAVCRIVGSGRASRVRSAA
ncbi:metal ABC transporter permease [Amnibacterium setariae]|uniref:Metal ABC transporter permease n=1 Tax=Amnibacterium setariae TaxID=2306585 RepID=A0A3A1U199_9MICO|nr:metal ABC transporter permease [Amnibacterium setariae]RIX30110.1 metal ABC transporter permease [Amnibacterium setariae]